MKLIFGLGNPGKQYSTTRHNIGFHILDSLCIKHVAGFVTKQKFMAELAELNINGEKIILARPQTFYNNVGESFHLLKTFFDIDPRDCLIIHDELALPLGTIRIREGGSDAGNNGIKSLNQYGGTNTMRVKVGIATEYRMIVGDADFVLGKFSQSEQAYIDTSLMPTIHSIIDTFTRGDLAATSHTQQIT